LSDEKPIHERVAEGDQATVGDFLSRYGDLVWSLARRYLGNHMEAEDAVQEICIEIWKNAGRYDRSVASEVAFISTITRRRLIDRLRQFNRRPGMESIDEQQAGYMRLSGLVANEPGTAQYQLWIVDPDRDARPVDGGVFDVPADDEEVIIPIDSKLRINGPAAFAITLEKPGGVVVSAGPLLVVAPVAG